MEGGVAVAIALFSQREEGAEASWYGASSCAGRRTPVLIRYSDSEEEELLTREQAEARVRDVSELKNTHLQHKVPICSWYIHFKIDGVNNWAPATGAGSRNRAVPRPRTWSTCTVLVAGTHAS